MKAILIRMLQSLLFILVSVWVLLALLLYIFQPGFVYYPVRTLHATPLDIGLPYDDVHLTTKDGEQIHGWFLPHETPRATLLFLHGNGGNVSHRLDKLMLLHRTGLAVLIIDYRGYGQSTGKPAEQGTYHDADAAWQYLTQQKNIPASSIIIYGESLGGGVASWLAEQHESGALILESTFTSMMDMGKHYYPYLPVSLLTRIKYPTIDRIGNLTVPLLIIHSPDDDIVPYSMGTTLFERANQPKDFLEIHGDHNNGFMQSAGIYAEGIYRFVLTHFPEPANPE